MQDVQVTGMAERVIGNPGETCWVKINRNGATLVEIETQSLVNLRSVVGTQSGDAIQVFMRNSGMNVDYSLTADMTVTG